MPPAPVVLSPALASDLLTYVLNHHVYPTTLLVCSTKAEFLATLAHDLESRTCAAKVNPAVLSDAPEAHEHEQQPEAPPSGAALHPMLHPPVNLQAISRHVRLVYIPTVTHLRAYLSVFSPAGHASAPPPEFNPAGRSAPAFVVYGIVELHRDTSEWSAQGLGGTLSALVEAAHRLRWRVEVVEPPVRTRWAEPESEPKTRAGAAGDNVTDQFQDLLAERIPILSGAVRRSGLVVDVDGGGWSGRTVEVGKVLERWYRFRRGPWVGTES